jgi:hypothetical protein
MEKIPPKFRDPETNGEKDAVTSSSAEVTEISLPLNRLPLFSVITLLWD